PSTLEGVAHSMCTWQSPNCSWLVTAPLPLTITPSSTFQFSPFFQFFRSLPLNSRVASAGGSPHLSPGVTTGGVGHLIPLRYSWASEGWLPAANINVQLAVNKTRSMLVGPCTRRGKHGVRRKSGGMSRHDLRLEF